MVKRIDPKKLASSLNSAVNAVLMARAYHALQAERMRAVDLELIQVCKPIDRYSGEPIVEPDRLWHMTDECATDFCAERDIEIRKLGYDLEPGYCPALMAENTVRLAEQTLLECSREFFPEFTVNGLLCAGLDKYKQAIELLIGLTVNAPGYRAPKLAA